MSYLKKQSQFGNGGFDVNVLQGKDYGNRPRFWGRKNKANKPAFGRKSEILTPKSETSGMGWGFFEKTKPIRI